MKKELKAALEVATAELVPQALGARFARMKRLPKDGVTMVFPGEIVFQDTSDPSVGRFVCFVPIANRNAFLVELGWSGDGQFPATAMRPSTTPEAERSNRSPCGFVRLTMFYSRLGEDWDVTPVDALDPAPVTHLLELEMRSLEPSEAAGLIRPFVEDACGKLQQFAPAFFDGIILVTGT
jgi:hypothetical protein